MSFPAPTIPQGSWVLVTGATGFLASHITLQFLNRGYRVRGTVRDLQQSQWLLSGRFKTYAEMGALELVSVPDFSIEGAFDEAVEGVSAILHTAYITRIVPDPNEVITPTVKGIRSIMNSALKESSVQEIVFTSSAMAALPISQDKDNGTIDRDSWNEAALKAAWAPPPYGMAHAMANYPASKVAGEKEVWKFVQEGKLPFTVNVVSPAGIIGEPLDKKHIEGPANWVVHAYRGNNVMMDNMQASFYANVKDLALIHVAAILDPEVKSKRLQSWGISTHWNEVLAILRELRPERKFLDDYPETYHLKVGVDQGESVELLKKWGGQGAWMGLREGVVENVENEWVRD